MIYSVLSALTLLALVTGYGLVGAVVASVVARARRRWWPDSDSDVIPLAGVFWPAFIPLAFVIGAPLMLFRFLSTPRTPRARKPTPLPRAEVR